MMNDKKSFIILCNFLFAIIINFLWSTPIMEPLKYFATATHESFHGIVTLLTGGSIKHMILDSKAHSGRLLTEGGCYTLISAAGYVGTAMIGSGLIASVIYETHKPVVRLFLISIFFMVVTFINDYYTLSFYMTIITALTLFLLTFLPKGSELISLFLGTFFAFAMIEDVIIYFSVPYKTDAGVLARAFGNEALAIPIACVFAFISILVWVYAYRVVVLYEEKDERVI